MSITRFDGSFTDYVELRQRLRAVDRKLAQGVSSAEARRVYGIPSVAKRHDVFVWALNQLDTKDKNLGEVMQSYDALEQKLKARSDYTDRFGLASCVVCAAIGAIGGAIGLGMTIWGSAPTRLVGEICGLTSTALFLGGIVGLARSASSDRLAEQSAQYFRGDLQRWGEVLHQERGSAQCPTRLLSLEEKRRVLQELDEQQSGGGTC